MADPQTTVFTQNGESTPIPTSMLPQAVKLGAMPGVQVQTSSGETTYVPANRVQEAAQHGAKPVPLDADNPDHAGVLNWLLGLASKAGMTPAAQNPNAPPVAPLDTNKPGMISNFVSDVANQIPHTKEALEDFATKKALSEATNGLSDIAGNAVGDAQTIAQRKAAGHGLPYILGAGINEKLGVNVGGEEESAQQGDEGGVLGHAAVVPAEMAATAGLAKGASLGMDAADAISNHPAFVQASNTIRAMAKPALRSVGDAATAVGESLNPDVVGLVSPRAAHALRLAKKVGNISSSLGEEAAPAPPSAALGSIPVKQPSPLEQSSGLSQPNLSQQWDAARSSGQPPSTELNEMTDRLAAQLAEQKGADAPTPADHAQAASVLDDSLKSSTGDVVDSAIPPDQRAANLNTKAEVDFHLQRGDVGGAEQALDAAIKEHAPQYSDLFAQRQGPVPSVMEIRQKMDAANQFNPAERWEDQKLDAQMQQNLDQHQWSAESEARREFIARNTTGWTKTFGTQAQRDAAHATAMASDSGDMTDLLQKSLQAAQEKKGQQ